MQAILDETDLILERLKAMQTSRSAPRQSDDTENLDHPLKIPLVAVELPKSTENLVNEFIGERPTKAVAVMDTPIGLERWEALAYDIALETVDDETLANSYEITFDALQKLREHEYFSKMVANKREEVKSLGSEAAFAIKMRVIANKASATFLKRLLASETSNKDFHTLFKTATELGQLAPKEEQEGATPILGATMVFNISGVPGLEHLVAGKEDVIEADYIDVTTNQDTLLEL